MASSRSRRFDVDTKANEEGGVTIRNTVNLAQLPLDTLINILSLISPNDIFSMRKSCKTLAGASKMRIVWMNAVRHLCSHHHAFGATFPLEKMSLSELEHAATSPDRLASRMLREMPIGSLEPMATRILKPRLPLDVSELSPEISIYPGNFHDLALVSGGRFLVTSTSAGLVQMWDLGYNPNMLIKPFSLASLVEEDTIMDMLTQAGPDEKVRLLLISRAEIRLKVDVFEVEPLSSSPRFSNVGNFSIGLANAGFASFDAYCLTNDQITFQIDGRTCVWNFVDDSWVMWFSAQTCHQIHVVGQNVFLLCSEAITIWNIPPLRPRCTAQEALVDDQTPLLTIICPLQNPQFPYPSIWYSGEISHHRPLHFDVLGVDHGGHHAVVRYVLKPIEIPQPDIDCPGSLPINVGESRLGIESLNQANGFRSGRLGEHQVLLLWRGESGTVNGSLSSWSTSRGNPLTSTSGVFWTPPTQLVGGSAFDHCPTSGRLCVMLFNEIRVMDYVLPPDI